MEGNKWFRARSRHNNLLSGPSYVWAMFHMWSQQEARNTPEIKGVPNSNICNNWYVVLIVLVWLLGYKISSCAQWCCEKAVTTNYKEKILCLHIWKLHIDCIYIIHILPGRWVWNSDKTTTSCTRCLVTKVFRVFVSISRSGCQSYVYAGVGRDEHHWSWRRASICFLWAFIL